MGADAQLSWIASAVDALEGIRAEEVWRISAEIRRSVTRPAQIVPEIARLVAERRARTKVINFPTTPAARAFHIDREAHDRLMAAVTLPEIEAAQDWARAARIDAGLAVRAIAPPLTRAELDELPDNLAALGLKRGLLERRADKRLYELPRAVR